MNENALHPEIERIIMGSYKELNPPDIEPSGFVVKTLEW